MSATAVPWTTPEPIPLAIGLVAARGTSLPQVRDSGRAAAVGDASVLVHLIQSAIVQSLAEILEGMEPSTDQLAGLREDLASLVLVSANRKLAAAGVSLLDLTVVELQVSQP